MQISVLCVARALIKSNLHLTALYKLKITYSALIILCTTPTAIVLLWITHCIALKPFPLNCKKKCFGKSDFTIKIHTCCTGIAKH